MLEVKEYAKFDRSKLYKQLIVNNAVVYRGLTKSWPATKQWTPDYFKETCPEVEVTIKYFTQSEVRTENSTMLDYVNKFQRYKSNDSSVGMDNIPYCHDIPIFLQSQKLIRDVNPFPSSVLPVFYRQNWWKFVQFFMSPAGAVTPLHFDTLRTNNLFFQIKGCKKFTLIPWDERELCSRKGWRWFNYDPEKKEHSSSPDYSSINTTTVEVHEGDVLVMPAGMLHHVRSLTDCVSFNIDFHTHHSVLKSFKRPKDKMPIENYYYNWLCFRGLFLKMGHEHFFSKYKPYLNYIS